MIIPDVNVLVGAMRADCPRHRELADLLAGAVEAPEALALTPAVLGGVLRILTHPRVFAPPTPLETALDQIETLRTADGVVEVGPGPRHWEIVARLCRQAGARGNLAADAAHAAVAVEQGATWVTLDRDFARFPGLRWRAPV
ncbi:MAG: PIN domain-containing protein [Bifidobacteriaceae bacterium]|nr:PIN domain-containing protein [Bifidobacteriaceae bacterium]